MQWFFPLIASGLALCLIISIYTDVKSREISNLVVIFGSIYAIAMWTAFVGISGLKLSLGGGFLSFTVFLLFALIGDMGMGDVKLMGMSGFFFAWPFAIAHIGYTVIAGFIFAVIWVVAHGHFLKTIQNLVTVFKSWILPNRTRVHLEELETSALPYGIAIAAGGFFSLAAIKFRFLDFFHLLF
ncbi:prepilin peptidase [Myxococcota bacterium]|nr:prepilin peptidase [Myxococcota bacterium]MBU1380616.1 prepilin peptidase [Myxococcota bacterium]MBU1496959.1 prepilin peptidase [Myxococcota bacterium]